MASPATKERHKVGRSPLYWLIFYLTTSTSYWTAGVIASAVTPTIGKHLCAISSSRAASDGLGDTVSGRQTQAPGKPR